MWPLAYLTESDHALAKDSYKIKDLQKRLVFQTMIKTDDGQGGSTTSWLDSFTVWGAIEAWRGREFWFGERLKTAFTHRIIIRYKTGVTSDMRISYDGRLFQIHSIKIEDEKKFFLHLDVEEGVQS